MQPRAEPIRVRCSGKNKRIQTNKFIFLLNEKFSQNTVIVLNEIERPRPPHPSGDKECQRRCVAIHTKFEYYFLPLRPATRAQDDGDDEWLPFNSARSIFFFSVVLFPPLLLAQKTKLFNPFFSSFFCVGDAKPYYHHLHRP